MKQFEAPLIRPAGTGTWTYVHIPFNVEMEYGTRGQLKVKGTINGIPFRNTLMPNGDGTHYLVVNKSIRDEAGVSTGDIVHVVLEQDTESRTVDVPEDFHAALNMDQAAATAFEQLSYSHQKEYVDWIVSAKKDETRVKRIGKAIEMLRQGKKAK